MSSRTIARKITSITEIRANARRQAARVKANGRAATTLMVVVAALTVIGLTATLSASSTVAIAGTDDRFHFFKRQLVGIGIGAIAMAVTSRIPYQWYRRMAFPIFVTSLGLLVAVLFAGQDAYGARRWINLGPLGFQPSELAKFGVVIALATVMEKKARLLDDFGHFLAPVAAIVGLPALLVMLEPDLGTTIVIAASALTVLLVSSAPIRFVALTGALGAGAAAILAFSADYRRDRLVGFLDPWADPEGVGWQLIQSYYALGTGGLFGVGLGASRARWFYLPNAHTDFIFAIIGEESGFVGASLVILLFVLLGAAGWAVTNRAPDPFGRMLAAGITAWLTVQAVVNIGGVLGVLPITGITLPFVSFGGTAVAVSMAAVGVLMSVAQSGRPRRRPRT